MKNTKLSRTVLISLFIVIGLFFIFDMCALTLSGEETATLLAFPAVLGMLTSYYVL